MDNFKISQVRQLGEKKAISTTASPTWANPAAAGAGWESF